MKSPNELQEIRLQLDKVAEVEKRWRKIRMERADEWRDLVLKRSAEALQRKYFFDQRARATTREERFCEVWTSLDATKPVIVEDGTAELNPAP